MQVLIAGGGIAGLACAIALADRGHAVTLVERRPCGRAEGAGLILWPQACQVLGTLGLLPAITAHAAPLLGLERRSLTGERLQAFDFRDIRPPAVLRAHVMAVLEDAARQRDVKLHFGLAAVDVTASGGPGSPAVVATADGRRFEADLVVGADGRMDSVVGRRLRTTAPVDHGLVSWVGVAEGMAPALGGAAVDFWVKGARLGVVPCGADRAYWAATVRAALVDDARPWRDTVQALLPDAGGLVQRVLSATDEAVVHRHRLFDVEPDGAWHRDRLVLVGDAAHASLPTTGRGATEALLDADALAAALPADTSFSALQAALSGYTRARRADATANMLAARELSRRVFG